MFEKFSIDEDLKSSKKLYQVFPLRSILTECFEGNKKKYGNIGDEELNTIVD